MGQPVRCGVSRTRPMWICSRAVYRSIFPGNPRLLKNNNTMRTATCLIYQQTHINPIFRGVITQNPITRTLGYASLSLPRDYLRHVSTHKARFVRCGMHFKISVPPSWQFVRQRNFCFYACTCVYMRQLIASYVSAWQYRVMHLCASQLMVGCVRFIRLYWLTGGGGSYGGDVVTFVLGGRERSGATYTVFDL